ncbi:hypothetical protein PR202_ga15692 [Eleusine coracana subsp. coracana]|uniref:F-box associated beta-propeller type 3 domain-containing protein n=1 Tax=Eleusine coracana subsp. coracana TaxID=191504 RepID=A0AAV5CJL3_ELECO|nr:hypothetical protein PR202_ga15692 [Eleusine coracana subsp. coracana]
MRPTAVIGGGDAGDLGGDVNGSGGRRDLGEDVVTGVSVGEDKLPTKSVIRCKFVCNAWFAMVSSQHFVSAHLEFSKVRSSILVVSRAYLEWGLDEMDAVWMDFFRYNGGSEAELIHSENITMGFACWVSPLHCDGLVLVSTQNHEIVVCNPATREFIALPKGSNSLHKTRVGFGFDRCNNKYKAARFFYQMDNGTTQTVCKFEVLTLGSRFVKDLLASLNHEQIRHSLTTNCSPPHSAVPPPPEILTESAAALLQPSKRKILKRDHSLARLSQFPQFFSCSAGSADSVLDGSRYRPSLCGAQSNGVSSPHTTPQVGSRSELAVSVEPPCPDKISTNLLQALARESAQLAARESIQDADVIASGALGYSARHQQDQPWQLVPRQCAGLPGYPRDRPRMSFKMAQTTKTMADRLDLLLYKAVVVTEEAIPSPLLSFSLKEKPVIRNRTTLPFHVKLSLEGVPQHAWFQEIAEKVLSDECIIHHVDEESEHREDQRAYVCWAFAQEPSRIPQLVYLTLDDPGTDTQRRPQVHLTRPRGIKRATTFRVFVHIDSVEDLCFYHYPTT